MEIGGKMTAPSTSSLSVITVTRIDVLKIWLLYLLPLKVLRRGNQEYFPIQSIPSLYWRRFFRVRECFCLMTAMLNSPGVSQRRL